MEWMAVAAVAVVAAFLGMAFGWFIARTRAASDAEAKIREAESIAHSERIRGDSLEMQRLQLQAQCDDLHERLRASFDGACALAGIGHGRHNMIAVNCADAHARRKGCGPAKRPVAAKDVDAYRVSARDRVSIQVPADHRD